MIELKKARIKDAGVLVNLIQELADYEKLADQCVITEELMKEALRSKTARGLIAWKKDVAVGYAIYYITFSTFTGLPSLYLEDLYVKPDYRSQGIGTLFFVELAKIAKKRYCQRMDFVCLTWNTPSLDYYRSLGAVVLEDWHLVRMEKEAISSLHETIL
ncbi:MAG: N-acetyltransferase family protein [Erysipelotrichaceae bacterium]